VEPLPYSEVINPDANAAPNRVTADQLLPRLVEENNDEKSVGVLQNFTMVSSLAHAAVLPVSAMAMDAKRRGPILEHPQRALPINLHHFWRVIPGGKHGRSTVVLQTARGAKSHMMALRVWSYGRPYLTFSRRRGLCW